MSTYGGSTRSNGSGSARPKRFSTGNIQMPPPPPTSQGSAIPPAPSSAYGQENVRPRNTNVTRDAPRSHGGYAASDKPMGTVTKAQQHPSSVTRQARPSTQKESVMARNRQVRAPAAFDTEDAVTVSVSIVGTKFRCLVEKEWPCESLVASAIAEYHIAYPTCEVPDCSLIFHAGRKEALPPRDPVGKWCRDGDEIELGLKERPAPTAEQAPKEDSLQFHTYDFTVMFHRLPLGFTMKQEMDATVVAAIYPKSPATHYARLVPGTVVVKIGDTPLEFLGLRQVHDIMRSCKLPLPIRFRGWKKPVARRASIGGLSESGIASPRAGVVVPPAPASEPHAATMAQRRKSVPTRSPSDLSDTASNSGASRARANTEQSAAAAAGVPALFASASEMPAQSPYSQSKQKLSNERKKTNASSPYPEHRERRTARSARGSPVGDLAVPLADQLDAISNQGGSPDGSPTSVADLKLKQKEYHLHGAPLNAVESVVGKLASTTIGEPTHEAAHTLRHCDTDSNQNEDESEEMLMEHIKILQAELTRKQEEARQLASQLEKYHERLSSVKQKREKREKRPSINASATEKLNPPTRAPTPKLTLTPEVLEAMDTKSGLPRKSQYAGSNASSVSGYSNYSSRSAIAKRHSHHQLARVVGKTGDSRGDGSVSSFSSANRRERSGSISFGDGLKSPRHQAANNVGNRYNFMPAKYALGDHQYEPPSSFSTKGGLISRAKITRDSYIKIADTPGVGAYDVKLPQDKVRGGEIGDSDRALPWP